MNVPSQILICNPQIEWSTLPYICLLSAFPRLFAPPLLHLLQVDLTRSLASFSFRAILNRTTAFLESRLPCLCECVRLIVKKMLKVGGKKEKKRRRERKKEKKHTDSIARIRVRVSPPTVSFACLKLHHTAKKTRDTFDRWMGIMSRSRDPPSEKETLLTRFLMQIK